jgi:hypothetical protein
VDDGGLLCWLMKTDGRVSHDVADVLKPASNNSCEASEASIRSRDALSAASLAMDLRRADSDPEGTNMYPLVLSPPVKYCIYFACVAQSQAVYQSRLKNDDVHVPPKKIHFYEGKEKFCPPPNNIAGARTKKKKILAPSSKKCFSPAAFVKLTSLNFAPSAKKCVALADFIKSASLYVAPSANKCVAPAVLFKLISLCALSGTAGCKFTGCQELKAGVVYKLECYHCEG